MTGINLRGGRVHEVVTDKGTIRTDVVVNAGGMYAPQIGRMVGVNVPIITYGHEFLVTEAFIAALAPLPTLRDPDRLIYFRTEVGGLIMGGYERNPAPWALDGVPDGFEAQLLPEDWPRFEPLLEAAVDARARDGDGRGAQAHQRARRRSRPTASSSSASPMCPGFWVAAGFCAHGLAGAGGMGWQVAEWIANGEPSLDLWHMDSRRFGAPVPQPRLHARAGHRGVLDLLRHQVPQPRAHRRPAAAALAGLRPPGRAGRELRREVGLGAGQLVRAERGARRRVAAPARLGGPELVAGDPCRGDGDPRAGGALRRDLVRQDRGQGPGAAAVPAAAVRKRRRPAGRAPSPTPRC